MAAAIFFTNLKKSLNLTKKFILSRPFSSANVQPAINRRNLPSRIIPLGNPSISLVPVLDQWVEEGNPVHDGELRSIVKTLRGRLRFKQALEVSEWMRSKGLCQFSPGDQAMELDLIGKVRGLEFAENYFQNLSDADKTEKQYGALLNCYVRERLVDKSLSLMQKIKDLRYASVLDYNNIMCLYMHTGHPEKVLDVFAQMKEDGVLPNDFSYRICITSYGARSDLGNMEKVLEEMERQSYIFKSWNVYSMVANFFIKAGQKEGALIYLKKCEGKAGNDALAYNHLITHYASLGNKRAVLRIWDLLKARCKKQINKYYINMLGSLVKLGDLEEAEKVLQEWESSGNYYDFRVPNVLLNAYSHMGMIEKAETLLQSMTSKGKTPIPNSWSIIASGYVTKQHMEKAFQCMKLALALRAGNEGWRPKLDVISGILSWGSDHKNMDEVEEFVNSLKTVIPMNRDMYLSLLKVYVRSGEQVDEILERMKADGVVLDEELENILSSKAT
ncbi:pentatricopeptide repeat-containing protein At4g21705, mitochondrial-like [Neltuma alba]|uniref:pentatricopeptide repeat-containing protein At4g21705, mitochondrial-like n=1 Tax=Neltuma alba TaxID=207710 RepID=UPI0010A30B25|nr:pentatricopeptide repeat-containing protein At4g21705, mitochondrial-like [Prosopis alba]